MQGGSRVENNEWPVLSYHIINVVLIRADYFCLVGVTALTSISVHCTLPVKNKKEYGSSSLQVQGHSWLCTPLSSTQASLQCHWSSFPFQQKRLTLLPFHCREAADTRDWWQTGEKRGKNKETKPTYKNKEQIKYCLATPRFLRSGVLCPLSVIFSWGCHNPSCRCSRTLDIGLSCSGGTSGVLHFGV